MEDNLNYIIRNTPEQKKEEKKDNCNLCNYFGVVYAFDKTGCKKCYDDTDGFAGLGSLFG